VGTWEVNSKIVFKVMEYEGVNWIQLAKNRD
jgi:hypothetical protein